MAIQTCFWADIGGPFLRPKILLSCLPEPRPLQPPLPALLARRRRREARLLVQTVRPPHRQDGRGKVQGRRARTGDQGVSFRGRTHQVAEGGRVHPRLPSPVRVRQVRLAAPLQVGEVHNQMSFLFKFFQFIPVKTQTLYLGQNSLISAELNVQLSFKKFVR